MIVFVFHLQGLAPWEEGAMSCHRGERKYLELNSNARESALVSRARERPRRHRRGTRRGPAVLSTDRGMAIAQSVFVVVAVAESSLSHAPGGSDRRPRRASRRLEFPPSCSSAMSCGIAGRGASMGDCEHEWPAGACRRDVSEEALSSSSADSICADDSEGVLSEEDAFSLAPSSEVLWTWLGSSLRR